MQLRCLGLKGLLDCVLHVGVELLDELEERLNLVLQDSLEGTMKVDDDFECKDGIVLIVIAKHVEHGRHEGVSIRLQDFLLWKTVGGLEDDVSKTLFWSLCCEAAWRGVERCDERRNDMFEEEGVIEVLE